MSLRAWLCLTAFLGLLLVTGRGPADEPKTEPPPEEKGPPAELIDAGFDRYLDLKLLSDALAKSDAVALTDCALLLAEGERVLLRPHKSLRAEKLLLLAARAAGENRDKDTLTRLERAAAALKNEQLAAAVETAMKLAASPSRNVPPEALDQARPEVVILYRSLNEQIRSAKALGSKSQLDALEKTVQAADEMDEKLKTALVKQVAEARSALPSKADPELDVLAGLALASRGRVVGKGPLLTLHNATRDTVKFRLDQGGELDKKPHSLSAGATQSFAIANPKGAVLHLAQPDGKETGYQVPRIGSYSITKTRTGRYEISATK